MNPKVIKVTRLANGGRVSTITPYEETGIHSFYETMVFDAQGEEVPARTNFHAHRKSAVQYHRRVAKRLA